MSNLIQNVPIEAPKSLKENLKRKMYNYLDDLLTEYTDLFKSLMKKGLVPKSSKYFLLLAWENLRQKRYSEAVVNYSFAIEKSPSTAYYYNGRAEVKIVMQDYLGAVADLNTAITLKPEDGDYYLNRWKARSVIEGYHRTLEDYIHALELKESLCNEEFPNELNLDEAENHKYLIIRGNAKEGINDLLGAKDDYRKVIQIKPELAQGYILSGRVNTALNEINEAMIDFDKALILEPNSYEARVYRGMAKLNNNEKNEALEEINRAIEINPQNPLGYASRGKIKQKLNNLKGALQDYDIAVNKGTKDPIVFLQRGKIKIARKQNVDAIKDFNRSIEYGSKNAEAYYLRAHTKLITYNNQALSDTKNLHDLNIAIELDPHYVDAYLARGVLKFLNFRYYFKSSPRGLANCYVNDRSEFKRIAGFEPDDARNDIEEAIRLNPDLRNQKTIKDIISEIEDIGLSWMSEIIRAEIRKKENENR